MPVNKDHFRETSSLAVCQISEVKNHLSLLDNKGHRMKLLSERNYTILVVQDVVKQLLMQHTFITSTQKN